MQHPVVIDLGLLPPGPQRLVADTELPGELRNRSGYGGRLAECDAIGFHLKDDSEVFTAEIPADSVDPHGPGHRLVGRHIAVK